ncbi:MULTISPECIES: MoaD/ThiS family protein [Ralstonia solanacearum species complex]|uniref:Molybdopterin converting factor, small subunit protein n=3 Tax=Ralstonia solanacearum TaxID=305 RepID=A0A7U7JEK6_RALSL|nr:MoaD/ThiS family protein [Ralstonia solanacearum]ALF90454.1 Sulfur carrier protein CysO [Ralstonia solanacearum]ATI29907.1 molybdopterin synthase sulfur carrier subunit [Ralstonia solanacearum]ATJ88651.1 molybdopterin synthase sulfur carrier subunit [Ralstonia solanacearum]EAP71768.1 ThiS family protein [Ralstonia solanacearum UW551]KEI30486.1 molybdenum cofactor biosynthesis protein MoaD [Ralstonia solanacearum]
MTVIVHIPALLRPLTNDQKRVEASGASVREVIEHLERHHPGIQARLMQDGRLHRFMNLYVNDDDIRFAGELAAPVRAGDSITILPAVAGGSGRLQNLPCVGRRE